MGRTLKEIEADALLLSEDEQVLLIHTLSENLHKMEPEIEKAWVEEAKNRWAEIESGRVKTIPGDQVLAAGRARLNAKLRV